LREVAGRKRLRARPGLTSEPESLLSCSSSLLSIYGWKLVLDALHAGTVRHTIRRVGRARPWDLSAGGRRAVQQSDSHFGEGHITLGFLACIGHHLHLAPEPCACGAPTSHRRRRCCDESRRWLLREVTGRRNRHHQNHRHLHLHLTEGLRHRA
jgi:hypothetical protein